MHFIVNAFQQDVNHFYGFILQSQTYYINKRKPEELCTKEQSMHMYTKYFINV